MPFDAAFLSTTPAPKFKRRQGLLRDLVGFADYPERVEVVHWISGLAAWDTSFDFTFGGGRWKGRRNGRRKEQRDGLLVHQRYGRGQDIDDALDLFRRFMHRVLPGRSWVAAIEPNPNQQLNPGHHGHAMFRGDGEVYRKEVHDKWVGENGWNKVNPIRSLIGCQSYCTKHLTGRGKIFGYEIYDCSLLEPKLLSSL